MTRRLVLLGLVLATAGCVSKPVYRGSPLPSGGTAPPAAVSKSAVEEAVEPWLGTPYRYGGTDRRGLDCSALAQLALGDLGVTLPRTVENQRMQGEPVARSEIAPGDLVFFRLESTRVNHVGVALGKDRFAHASTSRGVVIDRMMDDYFARRFVEARRVVDSEGG